MVTHELAKMFLLLQVLITLYLVLPFPKRSKKMLLCIFSSSRYSEHLVYFFRILFIFNTILFVDSKIRIMKHPRDYETSQNIAAAISYFYTQRNVYLTGFTLFLFIVINRIIALLLFIYKEEDKIAIVKKQAEKQGEQYINIINTEKENTQRIAGLESVLEEMQKKCKDADSKIKQAKNQQEEYLRLAEKYTELEKKMKKETETRKDK